MNFQNWYNKMVNEGAPSVTATKTTEINTENAEATTTTPTVAVPSKEEILGDVDSIMTQLNQLSAQIKEERIAIEQEYGFQPLDESLILEGAWDDTKQNFGNLFSDPLFQLVGLGIGGILGAIGLSVKAVKDTKRNSSISAGVMNDYNKLKSMKLEEVKLEATIQALETKRDEIEAENTDESVINEAPDASAPAKPNTPAKPSAAPAKPGTTAKKPVSSTDKGKAMDKMVSRIETQIDAISKKKESLAGAIEKLEGVLDAKYDSENITGFGSNKVRKLIASAKDGMEQEVATLKLKLMSDSMDPEMADELKNRIIEINKRSAERRAEIEKEAKENAEKAKEIADKDEETKNALDKINQNKEDKGEETTGSETTDGETSDSGETTNDGPSDAEQAVQSMSDDQKKKEKAAELKKKADDRAAEADPEATKDKTDQDKAEDDKKRQDRAENAADDEVKADKEKDKGTKQGKLDRLNDLMKKAKDAGDEEKIKKIQDLIDKVSAKESWQLEGTELGRIFEMEISRLENEFLISESKALKSIDKFRALLG